MIKKIDFKNETSHRIVFNMWSENKVTENTILYPIEPNEVREIEVIVPDDTYEPEIQYLGEYMILPHYKKID